MKWLVIMVLAVIFITWQANLRGGGDAGIKSFFNEIFGGSTSGGSSSGGSSGSSGSGSSYGTLSVSNDGYGDVYVNGRYLGRGGGNISLPPGNYTVTNYSASTGKLIWQKSTYVLSGKTSVIRDNTWSR